MPTTPIIYIDRDFLLAAQEPDEVELLRQELAELQAEISIKTVELQAIEQSLAGTINA